MKVNKSVTEEVKKYGSSGVSIEKKSLTLSILGYMMAVSVHHSNVKCQFCILCVGRGALQSH